jgi:FKBP-type peptidyl-prolyl cis-trans isomerase FkpA
MGVRRGPDHHSNPTMLQRVSSVVFVLALLVAGCGEGKIEQPDSGADTLPDLLINDITVGDGPAITAGQVALVHYTLWFRDPAAADGKGQMIQSSKDSGNPFDFQIGRREVIDGWDQGVPGMKVGGVRELRVPSRLAYGEAGMGPIPGNQDLIFEIELLEIR